MKRTFRTHLLHPHRHPRLPLHRPHPQRAHLRRPPARALMFHRCQLPLLPPQVRPARQLLAHPRLQQPHRPEPPHLLLPHLHHHPSPTPRHFQPEPARSNGPSSPVHNLQLPSAHRTLSACNPFPRGRSPLLPACLHVRPVPADKHLPSLRARTTGHASLRRHGHEQPLRCLLVSGQKPSDSAGVDTDPSGSCLL